MTHFEVFGLLASPDLDVKALEQRHRALCLECHPDRFAGADAKLRVQALARTTALNDAFKVLKDPVRRAFYLLTLQGIDLDSGAASPLKLPVEFLGEVMERREQLEAAFASRDVGKARALADAMGRLGAEALARAQEFLRAGKPHDAAAQLARVRYFARFLEEVDAFEEELLP